MTQEETVICLFYEKLCLKKLFLEGVEIQGLRVAVEVENLRKLFL
jgi:hypothetical protein